MIADSIDLRETVERAIRDIGVAREGFSPQLTAQEIGTITRISAGIARVSGLPNVGSDELLAFSGDVFGIAFNLDEDDIGVVLLGDHADLHAGDRVERTGRVMDVPVGEGLLGRVIDPLGRSLDGAGPLASSVRLPIERPAAAIMDRSPVSVPLQTGLKVIDALIPIGRGQRELILGDRRTGKSAIAIDAILNQHGRDVVCVYCAIGQRASAVAKAVANLRSNGAMEYTVVVVAEGNQAPGLAYVAPYAATRIAEFFMEAGHDVLIVYDDLTHHARAYRELSLLLRRPPGREAFPGDIFYLHSRLLERATHLNESRGGGSLTALPIIETEAQNISAYIPTNLISITDGQIYLSPAMFELGALPAVDVGKSVSRVGGKAQWAAFRAVTGDLKLAYAQFEERETFSRFGAQLDAEARDIIEHGKRIRACLGQSESSPVSVAAQITILLALSARLFDKVPIERMGGAQQALQDAATTLPAELCARFVSAEEFSDKDRSTIHELALETLAPFAAMTATAVEATVPAVEPGHPPVAVAGAPPSKLPARTDDSTTRLASAANIASHEDLKPSDQPKGEAHEDPDKH
jgi:F-type H+/Na+-transporting ATPase subunit alpha